VKARYRGLIVLFAAGALLLSTPALALTRVAFVIGDSNYAHEPQLINPSRDATAVADTLRNAGFDSVNLIADADVATLGAALRAFQNQALGADIAVLYYAGHGMEMNGINYLIPVDATLRSDTDLSSQAVTQAMAQEAAGGARLLSLVILDAWRDNPFLNTMTITSTGARAVSRGLAPVVTNELTANALVEYSAESGALASDGVPSAGHSPYAAAIINHVLEPGLDVVFVFGKVRDDVMKVTNAEQRPTFYGNHGGDPVYLVPPASGSSGAPRPPKPAAFTPPPPLPAPAPSLDQLADRTLWQSAVQGDDPARFQAYLLRYPDGDFASLARLRLAYAPNRPATAESDDRMLSQAYALSRAGDVAGALALYRTVAADGDPVAQYALGVAYTHGLGVARDYSEAMIWHRLAATRNYAPAQYAVCNLYANGLGVARDGAEAIRWCRLAADQGFAVAEGELGYIYAMGLGVPNDDAEALKWDRRSAASGNVLSMANMGLFYELGRGAPQNFGLAVQWYRQAASRGNAIAQAKLGLMYFQGRGVARDPVLARAWLTRAAAQGSQCALAWLTLNPTAGATSPRA
jgi:TPR repeat protein